MTTKEQLLLQIDRLDEEELEILYQLVERFLQTRLQQPSKPSFLEQLAQIQLDGPKDFAENVDLYLTGEKQVEANLH